MRPTHVLFNGGVFKADVLRQRLLDVLGEWFGRQSAPQLLEGRARPGPRGRPRRGLLRLDQAARRRADPRRHGPGVLRRHRDGRPGRCPARRGRCGRCASCRSAWKKAPRPTCPRDEIGLVVGEPAHFRFFSSSVRKARPARRLLLDRWDEDELAETDSLEADAAGRRSDRRALRAGPLPLADHRAGRVRTLVRQHAQPTGRWKLEFSVREDAEATSVTSRVQCRGITHDQYVDRESTDAAAATSSASTWARPTRPWPTSTRAEKPWRRRDVCRAAARRPGPGRSPRDAALVPLPAGRRANWPPGRCGCRGARTSRRHAVGFFARDHGALVPGRLIASAKSWLCHSGVDRTADLCPGTGPPTSSGSRRSRSAAATCAHIRDAWDAALPRASAGRAGHRAHAAGLVRRGRPRADRQGGRPGRAAARRADRGAAGGLLRLDRRPRRRLGAAGRSRARRSWSATSAAARPTSR